MLVAVADPRAVRSERTRRRQVLARAGVPSKPAAPGCALCGAVGGGAIDVEEDAATVESLRLEEQECANESCEDDTGQGELHGEFKAE